MLTDRERSVLLNLIPDIGSLRLKRLLEHFESLDPLWKASPQDIQQVEGIGPILAKRLVAGCRDERGLAEELDLAKRHGVAIVTAVDPGYPAPLREIPDPPAALYVRGAWSAGDETAVAMVGSRRASLYGLQCAERLAYDLALRGATIVSGLARGIDGAAHRGALNAQGRTVGVLGSGFCRFYPAEHEALAARIAERGAVISEYPMRMAPLPQNFPRRNRLISGLSLGVVIVEAAQRSGALITCDCALEQGKTVFAVPGPITTPTSQGTHQILREGAKLVTCVEDILDELHLEPQPVRPAPTAVAEQAAGGVTDEEQRLLACLSPDDPVDLDTLAAAAGLPTAVCAATLLMLELKRFVRPLPGKRFLRSPHAPSPRQSARTS